MSFYIRFTETIKEDIERNTSILTNHDDLIVEGLCVFFGENDIEKTIKKAHLYGKSVANNGDSYAILKGKETNGKKGSLGTVITNVELVSVYKLEL
jgi:hypothetical protein